MDVSSARDPRGPRLPALGFLSTRVQVALHGPQGPPHTPGLATKVHCELVPLCFSFPVPSPPPPKASTPTTLIPSPPPLYSSNRQRKPSSPNGVFSTCPGSTGPGKPAPQEPSRPAHPPGAASVSSHAPIWPISLMASLVYSPGRIVSFPGQGSGFDGPSAWHRVRGVGTGSTGLV